MEVIAYTCPVRRLVVHAEHRYMLSSARGDLRQIRETLCRFATWIFANATARVCAKGIEITQDGAAQTRIRGMHALQPAFADELGSTVRVRGPHGGLLCDRDRRRTAIDCGR